MYIDKLIKKEVITLLISVAFLVVVFIGVTFAKFLSVDKGEKTVINMGDLNISFCSDSTCDTTYSNIGQVIGTKVENGVTVPASIYPFPDDGTYSNETPYIFKVENTGTLDSTVKIKLKEDGSYTPTGDYSSFTRLSLKYPEHLKVAIRKKVTFEDTGYQLGDVNMDGIVNKTDADLILDYTAGEVTFSDLQKKLANIDSNSVVNAVDVTNLLRLINGKRNIEGAAATYIYSYTDLEDGVIFKEDIIKAGESATYFLWLYLDKSTPNDVQNTFFVGNIDVEGEFIPKNTVFCTTDTELTNGTTYVNGQYTYTYRESAKNWSVALTDLDSTDPVTSEVCTYINNKPITSMASMFAGSQAVSIDLSNINTSNVTSMSRMFYQSQATEIKGLENFDTSNVTSMIYIFSNSQVKKLNLSSFDTSKVTNMHHMFSNSQVEKLNLSSFDTSKVTNMQALFYESQATALDLSSFDTSKVKIMSNMFAYSQATTIKGLDKFDTSNVNTMSSMFSNSQATALDLSSFDTSKVKIMSNMFNGSQLKAIYVSDKFKTDSVTSSSNMFTGSINLVGGAGTVYDANNVDVTYARIDGGTSSPGYFTDVKDKPTTFAEDSWETIASSVKTGNIRGYKVGETKTIDMGDYGTHTVRVANTSTPDECKTEGFSQSACGFVLEFTDIITTHNMNPKGEYNGTNYTVGWNIGGWPASSMHTFVNNDIYNALPSELKNIIIDTTVVSSHGRDDTANFTSTDKLYLLAPVEIYSDWENFSSASSDTSKDLTRTLDYYAKLGVTSSNYNGAIKKSETTATVWWLRAAYSTLVSDFHSVRASGAWYISSAYFTYGVSPAFRIG